jgi:hypothetical protein
VSEKKKNIGTILLSIGSLFILFELFGLMTGIFVGPAALYFLGGVIEGVGVVFVLSGFLIRNDYVKTREMM